LILVLDRARIAARGTHDQLMDESPIYAEIYSSQLLEDLPAGAEAPPEAVLVAGEG